MIRKKLSSKGDEQYIKRIEEMSMLLVRQAIQNADFLVYSQTELVYSAIQAACVVLQLDKRGSEDKSFFYRDFRSSFIRMADSVDPHFSHKRLTQDKINELAERLLEFYKIFDKWHCGLNQLKTFKSLSFMVNFACPKTIKAAL